MNPTLQLPSTPQEINAGAVLCTRGGERIWLDASRLEYWDWHPLPFGWTIVGDHRQALLRAAGINVVEPK